ncbi:MAG: ABC transporter permease [Nocardioides sp.]|uniref:ABC transporter permease n=1 Tax=Nocardioides sp. TaxID=35761 RepID=UPI0039E45CEA
MSGAILTPHARTLWLSAAFRRLAVLLPVVRWAGKAAVLLFVVSVVTFLLISLSPGDAATSLLGQYATPATVKALQEQMHLDQPLPVQYWEWLGHVLHGDLGTSLSSGEPVRTMVAQRIGPTVSLVLLTLVVTAVIGVLLGVVSAVRGGPVARLTDALGLLGVGVPGFIIGLLLILGFSSSLGWLPPNGYATLADGLGAWSRTLVLPVTALVIGAIGFIAKQVRSAMVDALRSPFIRTLRANGFARRSVLYKHALRTASVPVLAALGTAVVGLLGGSVLIEQVFGIPGLGGLAVASAASKDLPVVQAVAVTYTLLIIAVNLCLDLLYVVVNPKVGRR